MRLSMLPTSMLPCEADESSTLISTTIEVEERLFNYFDQIFTSNDHKFEIILKKGLFSFSCFHSVDWNSRLVTTSLVR